MSLLLQARTTRRRAVALGVGAVSMLALRPAFATPEAMRAAIRDLVGDASPRDGRVMLEVPPLVENGNAVPVTVTVESPMTEADFVRGIALFNEKNPLPQVARFHLTPRSGRAVVSTRIRLADSQRIIAIAEMSDGNFWQAGADVIVTLAACVES
jgi:sulfur-oxidizing protein SoxY